MQARRRRFLSKTDMADSMVLTAIVLAVTYWGLEALINLFAPGEISFYRNLFGPNVGDMGLRVIALCLFLIFGSHVQFTINQRKRAEQALRESEEKYRSILETIEEGYYEVDLKGRFAFANDATSRILGVPKPQLPGMNIRQFLHGDSDAKLSAAFKGCLQSGRPVKAFDCEMRQQNSILFIEASAALRRENGQAAIGFRGMLRDRTEKKKLEMDLLESYRKLQNARAATILGLAKLAEYRDEGTGTHLERIREYARLLAAEMARCSPAGGIDRRYIDDIYQSSILHDIGRQGGDPGCRAAQAGRAHRAGVRSDQMPHPLRRGCARRHRSADRRPFLFAAGQGDRLPPPRKVGRLRLSRGAQGAGDPPGGADRGRGRRLRRPHQQALLQRGLFARKSQADHIGAEGQPFRP